MLPMFLSSIEMRPFSSVENWMNSGSSPYSAGNDTSMPVSVTILWQRTRFCATALRSTATRSGRWRTSAAVSNAFRAGSESSKTFSARPSREKESCSSTCSAT